MKRRKIKRIHAPKMREEGKSLFGTTKQEREPDRIPQTGLQKNLTENAYISKL